VAVTVGSWSVRVTRADVTFGPVYFCAAASGSSTLCESSVAELASVASFDALNPAPQPLGRVRGFSGRIQSASFDYGISWFDTSTAPAGAAHSAHIEGEAKRGTEVVTFVADVDVVPQYQGQTAVPTEAVDANVESSSYRLEIEFRPTSWVKQLDFDAIAASGQQPFVIAPGSPEHNALLLGIKNLAPPVFRWEKQ
jgi:hypothetical protein